MNKSSIRVLLIDDDEDQYLILRRTFKKVSKIRYSLEWKATYDQAMRAIGSNQYDVILIDYELEKAFGTDIIRKAIKQGCKTPFILQTSHEETSIDLEAMEAGVVDYLIKDQITPLVLERSIRYAIKQKQTELRLKESVSIQVDLNDRLLQVNNELTDSEESLLVVNKELTDSKRKLEKTSAQMRSDLSLAKDFQQTILPHIKAPPYLKIVEKYFPFEDSVSGDIYDMAFTREGDLNVFLGDATGHGIAAAFMTMMTQMALDNIPPHLPTNVIMSQLNTLLNSRETGKSMTGVFLRISPEGVLTSTNAGHPNPIILPSGASKPVLFEGGGMPLGNVSSRTNTLSRRIVPTSSWR